jgi:hypothetical protein
VSGSDQNWNLTDGTNYVGEWEPNILTGGNSTGSRYYLDSTVTPTRLTKGVKYTFDIQVERGSGANTDAFQMRAWVYDDAGVEIYGPSDWKSGLYSGETLATTRWIAFNNRAGSDSIAFGLNGTDDKHIATVDAVAAFLLGKDPVRHPHAAPLRLDRQHPRLDPLRPPTPQTPRLPRLPLRQMAHPLPPRRHWRWVCVCPRARRCSCACPARGLTPSPC